MFIPSTFLPVRCLIYEVLLLFICVTGDHLPRTKTVSQWIDRYYGLRAILDNLVHGLVGFVSWAVVIELDLSYVFSPIVPSSTEEGSPSASSFKIFIAMHEFNAHLIACLFSMILAMVVDVDHFIMARSWRLKDAVSLSGRPPFHCTTVIPVAVCFSLLMSYHIRRRSVCHCASFSLLFITAWLSHHIRDAHRHGLWFWPLGSTPPLPYFVYISGILLLPLLVKLYYYSTMSSEFTSAPIMSTV